MLSSSISWPPAKNLLKANCVLCYLEKNTSIERAIPPTPIYTHTIRRFTDFSENQTSTLDSRRFSWIKADHHIASTELHLLVLCELPFITSRSGKKPSTFIEVHYKKQPLKIHHNVYHKNGFRGLFITWRSPFWQRPTENTPWCWHQE